MARLIVEEVDLPKNVEEKVKKEDVKPEILDDGAKVSSSEIVSDDNDQLMPDAPQTTEPPYLPVVEKKTGSPIFWIIVPGVFLLGAILGGIVFYQNGTTQKGVNGVQEETPSPTAIAVASTAPSASPSASIDLTKYTVSIFNGSGIPGEAGKAKTLLTGAGFKVGATANAATYDYTKTIIKAKSTVETGFSSALSAALGKTYVVDAVQTLATSSADTIQIVIGSTKATP